MNKERIFTSVIFDMDGVLIDSLALDLEVVNEILKKKFNKEISKKKIKEFFALEIEDFFREIFIEIEANPSKEEFLEIVESYKKLRKDIDYKVLPGIKNLLEIIKSKKIPIAVASNNFEKDIKKILERVELINYFDEIVGNDFINKKKPDPEIFFEAGKRMNIDLKKTIIFEDSIIGIHAANSSGAYSIGVSTGGNSAEELKEAGAQKVINSIKDFEFLNYF